MGHVELGKHEELRMMRGKLSAFRKWSISGMSRAFDTEPQAGGPVATHESDPLAYKWKTLAWMRGGAGPKEWVAELGLQSRLLPSYPHLHFLGLRSIILGTSALI